VFTNVVATKIFFESEKRRLLCLVLDGWFGREVAGYYRSRDTRRLWTNRNCTFYRLQCFISLQL